MMTQTDPQKPETPPPPTPPKESPPTALGPDGDEVRTDNYPPATCPNSRKYALATRAALIQQRKATQEQIRALQEQFRALGMQIAAIESEFRIGGHAQATPPTM